MSGTEKQVKWAEDIKAQTINKVAEMRQQFEADAAKAGQSDTPAAAAGRTMFEKAVDHLNKIDDAKTWINMSNTPVTRQSIKGWATA